MTTYTAIPNGDIDQDSPLTQPLLTALRDNPIAAREGATGAPYEASAWHPYDGGTIGDGNIGLIYDFAVSGTVATLETPAWVDGYEYRVLIENVSHNSGSTQSLQMELYKSADAAYTSPFSIQTTAFVLGSNASGFVEIHRPRILLAPVNILAAVQSGFGTMAASLSIFQLTGSNKISKARFSCTGGSIDAGRLYLQKRLCYF